jgi:hypothetical protein
MNNPALTRYRKDKDMLGEYDFSDEKTDRFLRNLVQWHSMRLIVMVFFHELISDN